MADQVERLIGPVAPAVGIVDDAGRLVVLDSQAVDGPLQRCAARHRVAHRLRRDVDKAASVVDDEHGRVVVAVGPLIPAHASFDPVRAGVGGAVVGFAVHQALHGVFVDRFVADMEVHQLATSRPKRLEVVSVRDARQIALQILPVVHPPVRRVHDAVEVLPDVVLGDLGAVCGLELLQRPIADVVSVDRRTDFGQLKVEHLGHERRARGMARPAGSSACRSGITSVASAAKVVRVDGVLKRIVSIEPLSGFAGPDP